LYPSDSIEPVSEFLYYISNNMRRLILRSLAQQQELSFSKLMRSCGLSTRYDTTGNFNYHLSELEKVGALRKTETGYMLTRTGRRMYEIVRLLELESRFLHKRQEKEGDKMSVKDGIVVRRAYKEDNPEVAKLVASDLYEGASLQYEVPKEYFEFRQRSTDFTLGITGCSLVFLAEEKGEAVGICWWTLIEKENVKGGFDKEAFLEHLYVKQGHDCEKISEQLMRTAVPYLLKDERVTILNVWYNKDEPLGEEFYAKFNIKETENLKLLMHVAEWARPSWQTRKTTS